jgi:predicted DNA-binding ribbon-helix-helix protein
MKSSIIKRSVIVAGHKTSVSLEDAFWQAFKEIAHHSNVNISDLVGNIDTQRSEGNLSSTIRLFVLTHFRSRLADDQRRAGVVQMPRANGSAAA